MSRCSPTTPAGRRQLARHSNGQTYVSSAGGVPAKAERSPGPARRRRRSTRDRKKGLASESSRKLLIELAVDGRDLFNELVDEIGELAEAKRIQIVTARNEWLLPLELAYERPAPDDTPTSATELPRRPGDLQRRVHRRRRQRAGCARTPSGGCPRRSSATASTRGRRGPGGGHLLLGPRRPRAANARPRRRPRAVRGQPRVAAGGQDAPSYGAAQRPPTPPTGTAGRRRWPARTPSCSSCSHTPTTASADDGDRGDDARRAAGSSRAYVTGGREVKPIVMLFGCRTTGTRGDPAGFAAASSRRARARSSTASPTCNVHATSSPGAHRELAGARAQARGWSATRSRVPPRGGARRPRRRARHIGLRRRGLEDLSDVPDRDAARAARRRAVADLRRAGRPAHVLWTPGRARRSRRSCRSWSGASRRCPAARTASSCSTTTHIDADHIQGIVSLLSDRGGSRCSATSGSTASSTCAPDMLGGPDGEELTRAARPDPGGGTRRSSGGPVVDARHRPADDRAGGRARADAAVADRRRPREAGAEVGARVREGRAAARPGRRGAALRAARRTSSASTSTLLAEATYRRDRAEANGSSIAFIATFDGKSVLCAADAHSEVLEQSLDRLGPGPHRFTAVKISHHGSKANLGTGLPRAGPVAELAGLDQRREVRPSRPGGARAHHHHAVQAGLPRQLRHAARPGPDRQRRRPLHGEAAA